jgi:hypothetical protein
MNVVFSPESKAFFLASDMNVFFVSQYDWACRSQAMWVYWRAVHVRKPKLQIVSLCFVWFCELDWQTVQPIGLINESDNFDLCEICHYSTEKENEADVIVCNILSHWVSQMSRSLHNSPLFCHQRCQHTSPVSVTLCLCSIRLINPRVLGNENRSLVFFSLSPTIWLHRIGAQRVPWN